MDEGMPVGAKLGLVKVPVTVPVSGSIDPSKLFDVVAEGITETVSA